MTRKKILYLSDSDLSKPGGAQQSMKVLVNSLKLEFDMYIITPKADKLFENHIVIGKYDNFKLRGKNIKDVFNMVKEIYIKIKRVDPEIIHIQMPATAVILNILLKMKLLRNNIKIVYTDRGIYGKYGNVTRRSIESLIPFVDYVVTTTEVNKNNYKNLYKNYKVYSNKFRVIHNTAGEQFDDFKDKNKKNVRQNLNVDDNRPVIGFCGRYGVQKNWPLAKEIIELCNKEINDAYFIIILGTDGSKQENISAENYLSEIKETIGHTKFKGFINLNNEEIAEVFYAFDYFVLTSRWESFGRTAVEAMSRKNIVLGTDVDGLAEVIGNDLYLFKKGSECVKRIKEIMSDKELEETSKDYFYNRYHEKFAYRNNIISYKELYMNLLASSS